MTKSNLCDREWDFTLVLSPLPPEEEDNIVGALIAAGCDDATLYSRQGRSFLTFSRPAASFGEAVISALRDLRKADIGAVIEGVDECNLVTLSEIARKLQLSRQAVHSFSIGKRGPGGFPPPACHISDKRRSALWRWCEVAEWLRDNNMIPDYCVEEACDIYAINVALEYARWKSYEPELMAKIAAEITTQ